MDIHISKEYVVIQVTAKSIEYVQKNPAQLTRYLYVFVCIISQYKTIFDLNLRPQYDIAIIGGGILGTSIAYFLSSYLKSLKSSCSSSTYSIILFEQERNIASHTSARNTGKYMHRFSMIR